VSDQLTLPFLTDDDLAALDVADAAIDRAVGHAVIAGRLADADQLAATGERLRELVARNAAAVRGAR
jgi:hypothetical protein